MTAGPGYDPMAPARDLERHLGDPTDPAVPFSFAQSRALDERAEFPDAICDGLTAWGLPAYFVPPEHGGRLRSYEELLHLVRLLARRDLTVAIGYGKTFLGSVSAWLAGTPEQCAELAAKVLAGAPVAWALTERDHGSDLLAGDVIAERVGRSFRLTGEKWLINNATRGRVLAVLARTAPAGGVRGFGVLLVDKDGVAPGTLRFLPKVGTLGIRGADISGVAFTGAAVPDAAHLGPPGSGVEVVLKGLQLTRTMCASLCLGAGEHALRIATDWAVHRRLYGRFLADLPQARRVLLDAYADLLGSEAAAVVASRMIHWLPEELSVASAAIKYLLPVRTEESIAALGRLLGARSIFLDGDFQKVARDARIVSLFDGNTLVNLQAIVSQFPVLGRAHRGTRGWPDVRAVAEVGRAVPPFDRDRLRLFSRAGVSMVDALADAARELNARARERPALKRAAGLAGALVSNTERVHASIAALPPAGARVPVAHFDAAKDFARCFAGAAAVTFWLANEADTAHLDTAPLWADGRWLVAVLRRVLSALGEPVHPGSGAAPGSDVYVESDVDPIFAESDVDDALWERLTAQVGSGRLLSLFDCALAEGGHRAGPA